MKVVGPNMKKKAVQMPRDSEKIRNAYRAAKSDEIPMNSKTRKVGLRPISLEYLRFSQTRNIPTCILEKNFDPSIKLCMCLCNVLNKKPLHYI